MVDAYVRSADRRRAAAAKVTPIITEPMVDACTAFLLASGRFAGDSSARTDAEFSRELLAIVMACYGKVELMHKRKVRRDANGLVSNECQIHMEEVWGHPNPPIFRGKPA